MSVIGANDTIPSTNDRIGIRRWGEIVESWYFPAGGAWEWMGAAEDETYLGGKIGIDIQSTSYFGDNFIGGDWVTPDQMFRYVS